MTLGGLGEISGDNALGEPPKKGDGLGDGHFQGKKKGHGFRMKGHPSPVAPLNFPSPGVWAEGWPLNKISHFQVSISL